MPYVAGFRPSVSGFKFDNSNFPAVPLIDVDVLGVQVPIGDASNGVCGGMVFAARDYFEAGLLPPQNANPPSSGALFDFIVSRLFDSFELTQVPPGPAKYMHLMNPLLPDHETLASLAGAAPHGRAWVMINEEWPKIKALVDGGRLAPLGLVHVKSIDPFQLGENHQVLVYGYDLFGTQLTLHVYDPNEPEADGIADSITISLDIGDPLTTTPVSMPSSSSPVFAFFVPQYSAVTPPGGVEIVLKVGPDRTVRSGDLLSLTASFVDAGASDTHTVTWTWGDASTPTVVSVPGGSVDPERTVAAAHIWHDSGTYTVTVTVVDQAGHSVSGTLTVTVLNVPPVVGQIILPAQPVDEGTTVTLRAGFTDEDYSDLHTATWRFDAGLSPVPGSVAETATDAAGITSAPPHAWGDDGVYTVTVTVRDDHGHADQSSATITVRNVEPTVLPLTYAPPRPWPGQNVHASAAFTDPGWDDDHTATIAWGDGPPAAAQVSETHLPPRAEGTASADHHYAVPGDYTVTLTVTDDDGGIGQATAQIHVELSPDMPGVLSTDNEMTFLTWVHSLPGSLGSAEKDWRTNGGTPSLWWLYEADGWLFLFRQLPGDIPTYDPQQPTVIDQNFLALAVPTDSFRGWFWGTGAMGAWVGPRIVASRGHVFAMLTALFG